LTTAARLLIAAAAALALADWIAVAPRLRGKTVEYLCKPGTMLFLIVAALALHPEDGFQRVAFVVALSLSLAGDVLLMLPSDAFVPGLAAFLGAHLAYVAGFSIEGGSAWGLAVALPALAVASATLGRRVLVAVRRGAHPSLVLPVGAYMTVISVMVAFAARTGDGVAIAGAVAFFASDSLIAWDRFVRPFDWARPAIMVTYHLAQGALVLSLVR
jgi:uncharacterized membrane protein YhhN